MASIDLLYTSDSIFKLSKSYSAIASGVPITPTAGLQELRPQIIVDYNATYLSANYLYLDLYGKYYFIEDKIAEIGKRIILICSIDPLMSFEQQLRACPCTIIRQQNAGINHVVDNKLPVNPNVRDLKVMQFNAAENYPFTLNASKPYLLEVL